MQLRYLRHRYDVVYDYRIAAVRKSAVWIFAAITYAIPPVVLEGMRPLKDKFEAILGGYSHRKNTSVSLVLVRLRFEAIFFSHEEICLMV